MTPKEHHRQVKDVLSLVLEQPPEQRSATLAERCGKNSELRRDVESLLQFEATADSFDGDPLVRLRPAEDEPVEQQIGPYRILKRLNAGGMGTVFLAKREGEIERQVALKLIHRGMNTDEIVRRFRTERQILAHLQHPYIAALYDGGATDDGRPYFAMEYVDGKPVDRYCRDVGLSIRERLELFCKVCEAVETSHRSLVAHLDLKPSNILVTADGTPKLLDFGIAKILDPSSQLRSWLTRMGQRPLTPRFASPEQLQGRPLGTASDTYSLGIVLYLLLAGQHPFRLDDRGEEEPPRPSMVVKNLAGGDGVRLQRRLSGDLDAIVMKALRKEPKDRYSSVEQFLKDIRHHLEGRPVAARAGTLRYRAGKYARRHQWGLSVAAAFVVLTVGFLVMLSLQLQQTRLERQRATMARELLVEILESTDPREEAENLTLEEILKRGSDSYGDDFSADRETAASVFHDVGVLYFGRGHYESAKPLLVKAVEMRREIWGDQALPVAESLHALALYRALTGESQAALDLRREAVLIQRRGYPGPHLDLARGINNLAVSLQALGKHEEAERLYREALEMKRELFGEVHLEVAISWASLGTLLELEDAQGARQAHERALGIRRILLPPSHPTLANSFSHMGRLLLKQGSHEEAASMYRKALSIRQKIRGEEHPEVAKASYGLARALHLLGKYEEAEEHYLRALRIRTAVYGKDHGDVLRVEEKLADLYLDMGA